MATDKKSYVGYIDWGDTYDMLGDLNAGKLIRHFHAYLRGENPVLDDKLLEIAFHPIKLQLKRDLVKYEDIKIIKTGQGKLGGIKSGIIRKQKSEERERLHRETKQNEANEANGLSGSQNEAGASFALKNEANEPVTVTDTVNVTVTGNVKKENTAAIAFPAIPLYKNVAKDKTAIAVYIKNYKPTAPEPYFDLWNIFAKQEGYRTITAINGTRKKKLAIRLREPDFNFVAALTRLKESTFTKESGWLCFDWIIDNDNNYIKILEGNYDAYEKPKVIPIKSSPSLAEIQGRKIINGETV